MRDPRGWIVIAALAGLLLGAQAPWWSVTFTGLSGVQGAGTVSGSVGTGGLAVVLPSVVLAAMLATLMLQRTGTRIMALAAGLVGVGMMALGWRPAAPVADAVQEAVAGGVLATMTDPVETPWPIVYGAVGLAVAAASVRLVIRPPRRRVRSGARAADVTDPLTAWKAMDAGEDPTRSGEERGEPPIPEEGVGP